MGQVKYGNGSLSSILGTVSWYINDQGIDALADYSYTRYMVPARRLTKIDVLILAAVHDEVIYRNPAGCETDPCAEEEAYDVYRRTLNL